MDGATVRLKSVVPEPGADAQAVRQLIEEIIALVEQACRPRESDPIPIPGPTPLDSLAGELLSFLSEKGVDAYYDYSGAADTEPIRRPWWQWWRKPNVSR